jgi:hypothetical protein
MIELNQALLLALSGRYSGIDQWTVQSNLHVRKIQEGSLLFNTLSTVIEYR